MDAAFLRAAYPAEHHCLGVKLLPLTFGQWFLLNEHCPYFTDREEVATPDLPVAAFICSRPYDEAERDLSKLWTAFVFRLWGYRSRAMDMRSELYRFSVYMRQNQSGPLMNSPVNAKRKECGGPWVWRLYSQMLSTFNMSEDVALRTPVLRGMCIEAAHNEHHGHIELAHSNLRMLMRRRIQSKIVVQ